MFPQRIVVVGAGLAGLIAAHELAARGAAVTIVEARARVGGRVWTVRDGFRDGHYAELGGEFVDEDHTHVRELARRFGLPLVRVLERGFAHRYRRPDGSYRFTRAGAWEMLRQRLDPLVSRYKSEQGREDADAIRELAALSVAGWLERQQAAREDLALATTIRGFFLADPQDLSVLPVVAQLAGAGSPAHTPIYRIAGGNDRLLAALLERTPARLLLQHTVKAVTQHGDRVVVHVAGDRALLQHLEADAVVMAIPAATLRSVVFTPALPGMQQKAIARLRYGRATKVVVQCAGAGLRRRRAQAVATDGPLGAFWEATEGQPATGTSMIAFLAGGSASPALRQAGGHGAAGLLADLCWLGLADTPVVASRQATWEDDPLAGGGYAYLDPAYDPAWTPLLSRRAGRIVFAGEHTSAAHQGYMEGALESGLRATAELAQIRLSFSP